MSIKIGNMILEKNQLTHKGEKISLNHENEFKSFIHYTKTETLKAIAELIDPLNIKLVLLNDELHVVKNQESEWNSSAEYHYRNLDESSFYADTSVEDNSKDKLKFIIGYNLLIYILSKNQNNNFLNTDGIEIAEYIISNAWRSAFTSKKEFDSYYIEKYEQENRMNLFSDWSRYRNELKNPNSLATPIKLNLGSNEFLFTMDDVFLNSKEDIVLINNSLTTYQHRHEVKIITSKKDLFKNIPERTSMFTHHDNGETYRFRTERYQSQSGLVTVFRFNGKNSEIPSL